MGDSEESLGWKSFCCCCRQCQKSEPESIASSALTHSEEFKDARASPNEPDRPVASSEFNTAYSEADKQEEKKKRVQDNTRKLKQKMVLMVKPVVGAQKPGELVMPKRNQDVWEGDTHLRILMEYQEMKKNGSPANTKDKNVTFKNKLDKKSADSEMKNLKPADTVSTTSGSVELFNYVIDEGASAESSTPSPAASPGKQDDILVKCDSCGASFSTNIDEIANHKHILSILHDDSNSRVNHNLPAADSKKDKSSKIPSILVSPSKGEPKKKSEVKVVEIMMDKSGFPCLTNTEDASKK